MNSTNTICATSQKEPFQCSVCDKMIEANKMYLATGCHPKCGGLLHWFNIKQHKPKLGEILLIFRQGYSSTGEYYSSYVVAEYMKDPFDRRTRAFGTPGCPPPSAWLYSNVTHWMRLVPPNEKVEPEK